MKSIRFKLFTVFIILLVMFQCIFLVTNTFFLDKVYISGNKKSMIKMYHEFIEKTEEGEEESLIIYKIANKIGGNVILIDKGKGISYSTSSHRSEGFSSQVLNKVKDIQLGQDDYTVIYEKTHKNPNDNAMIFFGKLSNDKYFIIEKSLILVYESSRIAEKFIMISSIGTLIIGSIIVFFLLKKLTKPIIQINHVAQSIADLNFNKRVKKITEDEIGVLGESINLISDKLSGVLKELKESNEKLREDIERERSLEKMRRKFVSSVSHELKTPISMIQGYADGLKFNIAKNPKDQEYYCDVIIEESDKMSYLIRDLLDLSSYESGIFKIIKGSFDFTELIRETTVKYARLFANRNIRLDMSLEEDCFISADQLRLEQIITNFISNAEKHVSENGMIQIELKKIKDRVYFSVFNTGELIPPSEMENIWTSFYKVASKENINVGTGLGLAIVRAIVELHEGKYGVDNMKNGVKLWIEIPMS